jgi:cytochrome c553
MRKTILLLTLTAAVITTITIISCESNKTNSDTPQTISADSLIKRGEYLVTIMGCDDCHSPKIMGAQGPELDMQKRLSGYPAERPLPKAEANAINNRWMLFSEDLTAAVGPWGVSFSANITSDSTGIGNWSEEQFKKAVTQGKYKGLDSARMLLPPMPWPNYRNLKDEDLKAIFAFLKSTKPIRNVVPEAKQLKDLLANK